MSKKRLQSSGRERERERKKEREIVKNLVYHCASCGSQGMDRYDYIKDIGSGNFGVARLMRDRKSKELVAVKFIERGDKVGEGRLKGRQF